MKKLYYNCIAILFMGTLGACSSQSQSSSEEMEVTTEGNVTVNGLQEMQVSEAKETFTYKGKEYHSTVLRRPDESLPLVIDEQGDKFIDNSIKLQLVCEGKVVIDKRFTKESFASLIDASFLKNSILEGVVYDKNTPQGMRYAASICYPQTDLYIPLSLTITADGKISIAKEELLEELYEDESN